MAEPLGLYKVGEVVDCIGTSTGSDGDISYGGAGWKLGHSFKISYITRHPHGWVYWESGGHPGVWEHHLKRRGTMKRIWEILIVDKTKDEIIAKEIVIDGDEKSACSKISIKFATKLKDLVFCNLAYIAKEIGSYESKKKD